MPPWWKNARGEWFVLGQFALITLLLFGPRDWALLPAWSAPWDRLAIGAAGLLILAGGLLCLAAVGNLGRNLSPFVCPKANSVLIERGVYRWMRHPIYSSLLLAAFGWALLVRGRLTLGYALLLFLLLDRKAAREECWLLERFPGYTAYRRRVRKFLPFLY